LGWPLGQDNVWCRQSTRPGSARTTPRPPPPPPQFPAASGAGGGSAAPQNRLLLLSYSSRGLQMGVEPAQPNPTAAAVTATTAEQAQDLIDVSPNPNPQTSSTTALWPSSGPVVPLVRMRYCRLIWILGSVTLSGR